MLGARFKLQRGSGPSLKQSDHMRNHEITALQGTAFLCRSSFRRFRVWDDFPVTDFTTALEMAAAEVPVNTTTLPVPSIGIQGFG